LICTIGFAVGTQLMKIDAVFCIKMVWFVTKLQHL